jgi:flagellar biogenesis protein FliO
MRAPETFIGLMLAFCATGAEAQTQRIGPPPTSERAPSGFTPLDVHRPPLSPAASPTQHTADSSVRSAVAEMPLAPSGPAPLPLKPRQEGARPAQANPAMPTMRGALGTVGGSLGIVLGVFLLVVICFRRFSPAASGSVPKEAVELLGRVTLSPKQYLQLIRLGNKLVLVALSPSGAASLAEVTDAQEVEQLTALCRRGGRGNSTAEFRQVLTQLAAEPAPSGFLGRATGTQATSQARGGR